MPQFWTIKNNLQSDSAELRIDGDIVDDGDAWLLEWFGMPCTNPNRLRNAIKAALGKHLDVWVNSYGGSVFAAAGIYNALREHGDVRVIVDGIAASAASVIAMAGERVEMSPVGMMMIHDPMASIDNGNAQDMRRTADVLDKVKETIVSAYEQKTGLDRREIRQMMSDETYMTAEDAVSRGFADAVYAPKTNESNMINKLGSGWAAQINNDAMRTALASIVARMDKPDGTPTAAAVPGEPDAEPTPNPDAAPTPTDSAAELRLARARLALKARTMQH